MTAYSTIELVIRWDQATLFPMDSNSKKLLFVSTKWVTPYPDICRMQTTSGVFDVTFKNSNEQYLRDKKVF
jgi:hypothetical protein